MPGPKSSNQFPSNVPDKQPLNEAYDPDLPTLRQIITNQFAFDKERFINDDAYAVGLNELLIDGVMDHQLTTKGWKNTYAELHEVAGRFIVMPDARDSHRHHASYGGAHSMFDGGDVKYFERSMVVGSEHGIAETLGLTTATLRAQGILAPIDNKGDSTTYAFDMRSTKHVDAQGYDWLYDFSAAAEKFNRISFTQEVEGKSKPFESPSLHVLASVYPDLLRTDEDDPYRRVLSGVLTGIQEDIPQQSVKRERGGDFKKQLRVLFSGVESATVRHEPVYREAHLERPHFFTVEYEGQSFRLACDYTEDVAHEMTNVLVTYDNPDQGSRQFTELRAAIEGAFLEKNLAQTEIKINEQIKSPAENTFLQYRITRAGGVMVKTEPVRMLLPSSPSDS
jgi:hypothetical protein